MTAHYFDENKDAFIDDFHVADDLELTKEEIAEREEIKKERKQFIEDLHDVVSTPQGERLLTHLLTRFGVEKYVGHHSIQLRNEGEYWLDTLFEASPTVALSIVEKLRYQNIKVRFD